MSIFHLFGLFDHLMSICRVDDIFDLKGVCLTIPLLEVFGSILTSVLKVRGRYTLKTLYLTYLSIFDSSTCMHMYVYVDAYV